MLQLLTPITAASPLSSVASIRECPVQGSSQNPTVHSPCSVNWGAVPATDTHPGFRYKVSWILILLISQEIPGQEGTNTLEGQTNSLGLKHRCSDNEMRTTARVPAEMHNTQEPRRKSCFRTSQMAPAWQLPWTCWNSPAPALYSVQNINNHLVTF